MANRETRVLDRPSWLNIRQHLDIIYAAEFWGTVYSGPRSDSTGFFYDLRTCVDRNLLPERDIFCFGPNNMAVLPKHWTLEPFQEWQPGFGYNAETHNPTAARNTTEREASQRNVIR